MYFWSFGRILEYFVNFLKWPEKKFEVIFRSIFHPLFIFPTRRSFGVILWIYVTHLSIVVFTQYMAIIFWCPISMGHPVQG
jgi:hypothetical protein